MRELLERVKAATGPDLDIDLDLARAYWPEAVDHNKHYPDLDVSREAFTASIDSAVALAERIPALHGRKLICFFCAGAQLLPHNADETDPDFHPRAKLDNSVTAGWMAYVAFYKPGSSETDGPAHYQHHLTAPLAILAALLEALSSPDTKPKGGRQG